MVYSRKWALTRTPTTKKRPIINNMAMSKWGAPRPAGSSFWPTVDLVELFLRFKMVPT